MKLRKRNWLPFVLIALLAVMPGCQQGCFAPEPAPSAPSDLVAIATSPTEVSLTWTDNSTTETGFYVYRSSSSYTKIATLGANTTSYDDSSLTPEVTYHYKVSSYNDGGESGFSNVASVTMPAAVEILNYYMQEEWLDFWQEWRTDIMGNVKNHTNQTLTIWMAGKFFDYNNIVVGTHYDLLDPVGPGETWQFEISHWGERINQVEAWVDDYYDY